MSTPTVIQPLPPQDDRDWDCQCARCGSSCDSEGCDDCDNDGFVENEDPDLEGDEDFIPCPYCLGEPVRYRCLSTAEWCQANPMTGREAVSRGQIEWFVVRDVKGG
jgi:hypothetical protein